MPVEIATQLLALATEVLKLINKCIDDQPPEMRRKAWERWDSVWSPLLDPIFTALEKPQAPKP